MDLQELRKEIDAIDDQIVALFCQRMAVSEKIGRYKKERNLPVFVPAREAEKLQDVASKATPGLEQTVQALYAQIFELSRAHQQTQHTEHNEVV